MIIIRIAYVIVQQKTILCVEKTGSDNLITKNKVSSKPL